MSHDVSCELGQLALLSTFSYKWLYFLQDLDETTERKKMFLLEQELEDQKEVNKQLKAYVGDVLINIIVQNPDILEKKSQQWN